MKTATERMRHILQDFHSGPSKCRNDSKQGISTGEICSYVQKSILMLQNELFSELHNRLPKFFNAIDLYRGYSTPVVELNFYPLSTIK
uniref:Uncharacterized protein n=1 Tax=Romanomermis culicivorax TaxID=13658 RepID=A0A915K9B1_ROMCU